MSKLATFAVVSILAVVGAVFGSVTATTYLAGELGPVSTLSASLVVVGLVVSLVVLLERTNRRVVGPRSVTLGTGHRDDRDTARVLDELRASGHTR